MTLPLLVLASLALADPDPAALVKKLRDPVFAVREAAEADLAALGLPALAALEAGVKDADPEVRSRCQRLLVTVRVAERKARLAAFLNDTGDLPGWARFRTLVPPATRKAYVTLYEADAALLDLTGKAALAGLADRLKELPVSLLLAERDKEALTALPAYLLVAGDPAVAVEPATLANLYSALQLLARREALRKDFLSEPGRAELLLAALARGGAGAYATTLPLAAELELKAAKPLAAKVATSATAAPAVRAQAFLALARLGDASDIPTLTPLLGDKAPVGSVTVVNQRITAELGDVALAALIHLRGGTPADYGFPYYQAIPGIKTLPSPERLGFVDAASRAAALAKWRAMKP